nr:sulfite exporter TauE/SafE family protein [Candidatus Sigynarchaeota archaeon]
MELWILLMIGLFACLIAIFTSMVGLGGGIFFIPMLVILFGIPPTVAVGCSLLAGAANTTISSIEYFRQNKVNVKIALIYNILDVPGVLLGAWVAITIEQLFLTLACGAMVIFMAIMLIRNRSAECASESSSLHACDKYRNLDSITTHPNHLIEGFQFTAKITMQCMMASFFGGLITGLAGLGGGTTDTCSMVLIGVPIQMAVGSSVFAMALTYWFALFTHSFITSFNWVLALILAGGASVGAFMGAHFQEKFKRTVLTRILAVAGIIAGSQLVIISFV